MQEYIGVKIVQAEEMDSNSFAHIMNRPLDGHNKEGYLVIYPDGYKSWSPKAEFEKAYHEVIVGENASIDTLLPKSVFPSDILSIGVKLDNTYGGAHEYQFQNSLGFDPETQTVIYTNSYQRINFIKKETDGTMTPGIQSEQLLIALIDRHEKLNARFPSEQNIAFIEHLKAALTLQEDRVRDRINRGVMGELKK